MSTEAIFAGSGMLVMPFWLLMALLPHWRWTRAIIGSPLISLPAALLYFVFGSASTPPLGAGGEARFNAVQCDIQPFSWYTANI